MGAPKFSPFLIIAFLALLLNFPFAKTRFVLFVWLPNEKITLTEFLDFFSWFLNWVFCLKEGSFD